MPYLDMLWTRSTFVAKARNVRHITRPAPLTDEEKTRYGKIREQVRQEFPPKQYDPVRDTIRKLRAIREEQGLSLSDIEARTKMARSALCKLENEARGVTVRTLERYARALGCRLLIEVLPKEAAKSQVGT